METLFPKHFHTPMTIRVDDDRICHNGSQLRTLSNECHETSKPVIFVDNNCDSHIYYEHDGL